MGKRVGCVDVVLIIPLLAAQGVAAAAWLAGSRAWWLDAVNNALLGSVAVAAAGLIVSVVLRSRVLAAVFGLCLGVWGARWALVMAWPGADADTPGIRILVANVYTGNPATGRVLALVEAEQPDVIGLLEVDRRWVSELSSLRDTYPHYLEVPRQDNFGIALYSRVPLATVQEVVLGSGEVPSIRATFADGTQVFLTHPVPPVSVEYAASRDAQLADLATQLDTPKTVVVGDLNATPWSTHFPPGFHSVAGGTWPVWAPSLLRIPIDHVLPSDDVTATALRLGPDIGSDHLPVLATLQPERL